MMLSVAKTGFRTLGRVTRICTSHYHTDHVANVGSSVDPNDAVYKVI